MIAAVSPLPAAVEVWSIFVGVGVGAGVGIIAGIYPASRAVAARSHRRHAAGDLMSTFSSRIYSLFEGVGIALDSLRSNRVRAGLTILGVAVGVFVVVVISAAIHGINASVAKDFESAGPTTFFLSRYPITFEACDGTRRHVQVAAQSAAHATRDNKALNALPSVRAARRAAAD